MPAQKKPAKLTQEELFPHSGFSYRLETKEDDGTKRGITKIAWFQCEAHLVKHVTRYSITSGQVTVAEGSEPLSSDPLAPKKKRKAPAKPKAKTVAQKPSATKASSSTKTKKPAKPAAKTTRTTRASKTSTKEVFSNLDTFFDQ